MTFQFSATVDEVPGTAVLWSIPAGAPAGSITLGGLYTAGATPGTYSVVGTTATDPAGSDTVSVTVIADPTPAFASFPDSVDGLAGSQVFAVTAAAGTTYEWSVLGGVVDSTPSLTSAAITPLDTADLLIVTVTATNAAGRAVSATDSASIIGRMIALPENTYGVAIGAGNVLASMRWLDNSVRFRSGANRGILRDVTTGSIPVHGTFTSDGSVLFVVEQDGLAVRRIVTATGATASVGYGRTMFNLAVAPDDGAVYATTGDGWLFKVHPTTLAKEDSVQLAGASNGLAIRAGGFWVSTMVGKLYKVDPATLDLIDSLTITGTLQRVALSANAATLYVADEANSSVHVVTTATKSVVSHPFAGTPYGLALAPSGTELWVALRTGGGVLRLATSNMATLGTHLTGGTPRNVAFSPDGTLVLVGTEANAILIR